MTYFETRYRIRHFISIYFDDDETSKLLDFRVVLNKCILFDMCHLEVMRTYLLPRDVDV